MFMVFISLALNRQFRDFYSQVVSPPSALKDSDHGKSRWSLSQSESSSGHERSNDREGEA
jgi:hypothetical protein